MNDFLTTKTPKHKGTQNSFVALRAFGRWWSLKGQFYV